MNYFKSIIDPAFERIESRESKTVVVEHTLAQLGSCFFSYIPGNDNEKHLNISSS